MLKFKTSACWILPLLALMYIVAFGMSWLWEGMKRARGRVKGLHKVDGDLLDPALWPEPGTMKGTLYRHPDGSLHRWMGVKKCHITSEHCTHCSLRPNDHCSVFNKCYFNEIVAAPKGPALC